MLAARDQEYPIDDISFVMFTATSGLMFDSPEDAKRAAELLDALFEQARAREQSESTAEAANDPMHHPDETHELAKDP